MLFFAGRTGHAEVVRVVFYPDQVSFANLLKVFWENHDPTQGTVSTTDALVTTVFTLSSVKDKQNVSRWINIKTKCSYSLLLMVIIVHFVLKVTPYLKQKHCLYIAHLR